MPSGRVLRYVELKTGFADNGPAWVARVTVSRSGRAVYFGRKLLKRARRGGITGNYFDAETGDEYWVSGVKKDGHDRHWAGSGTVAIEAGAVGEYLELVGRPTLDKARFKVVPDLQAPDFEGAHSRQNAPLAERRGRPTRG